MPQWELRIPSEVGSVLLDELVCAHASTLLLNAFAGSSTTLLSRRLSTDSALLQAGAIGREGMIAARTNTEVTWKQQGNHLFYLRRTNPFVDTELLA